LRLSRYVLSSTVLSIKCVSVVGRCERRNGSVGEEKRIASGCDRCARRRVLYVGRLRSCGTGQQGTAPASTKVFLNWLLSKDGQIKWQEKSDNNSLRIDIPKNMLSDPTAVPKPQGRYMNTSLPQYQDIDGALKIINEVLAKTGQK
jgi:hypothetical protein